MPLPMGSCYDDDDGFAVKAERGVALDYLFTNLKAIFAIIQDENAMLRESCTSLEKRCNPAFKLAVGHQNKGPGATLTPSCPRPVVGTSRCVAELEKFEHGSGFPPDAVAMCPDVLPRSPSALAACTRLAQPYFELSGILEKYLPSIAASPQLVASSCTVVHGRWRKKHAKTFAKANAFASTSPAGGIFHTELAIASFEHGVSDARAALGGKELDEESRRSEHDRVTDRHEHDASSSAGLSRQVSPASRDSVVSTPIRDETKHSKTPQFRDSRDSSCSVKSAPSRLNLDTKDKMAYEAAYNRISAKDDIGFDSESDHKCFPRMVDSTTFEFVFCLVICSNIVLMGCETEYRARNLGSDIPFEFTVAQCVYFIFFLTELCLRLFASGLRNFCCGTDWVWNFIDTVTVMFSAAETIVTVMQLVSGKQGNNSARTILQLVRLLRLLRVFRIVRAMRFLAELKTLCYSIFGTLKSLSWAIVLLVLIIYGFALLFTHASTQAREDALGSAIAAKYGTELETYFGHVGSSVQTLFMSISNGVSWETPYRALNDISVVWSFSFNVFVTFTYLCVLNVLTAHFCQTAIEHSQSDQDSIIKAVISQKAAYKQLLLRLYRQIDSNGSGCVNLKELVEHFEDEKVQAYLHSLDLEPTDAWTLFKLLDEDGGQVLDEVEFVEGCMRLRGHAKAIDLATLMQEQNKMSFELYDFMNFVDAALAHLCGKAVPAPGDRNAPAKLPRRTLASRGKSTYG